jgi:uncharacterized protein
VILRKQYIDKLIKLMDKKIIKVVTGVRRCGKSTLLLLFRNYLIENGIDERQIISINFEDINNEGLLDYRKLHSYVEGRLVKGKMTYIFLDEVQNVPEFQKAVDSLFIKDNVDVYITGSNAYLLSGELATLISGRYMEISMLPLSFKEFYEARGGNRREMFTEYYRAGAFPYTISIEDEGVRKDYLRGIYNTVLLKDIVARKHISDIQLLESVIKFLFANIGSIVSSKKISDSLISYGRKTTAVTVESYIEALMDSFIIYKADRYDVKGKQHLKSLEKYYIVDIGLRNLLIGDRNTDIGHILENIVYLELIRRGNTVHIGKVGDKEVDFIAEAGSDRVYYQVAASVLDPATFEREFEPLKKIGDNYPKFVLTMDDLPTGVDGISQMNIIDFLLK